MSKDPYQILGVAKDASQDAIRKAYRELAKQMHPDLNPGDAQAAERFKDVASAYGLLRDPEKRARFDRGEIDATGAERPQHQYYREYADGDAARHYRTSAGFEDLGDISDIFSDLFGQGQQPGDASRRRRGRDNRYVLDIAFLEAAQGAKKRITLPDGHTLDLTVPAGVSEGQILRLKGKGMPGSGGAPAGDALVEIHVRPHPSFARRGDDIHIELPITLDEAVLGGKVEAPTIDGRVSITVPKGASSGQLLRLRGKGVPRADGAGRGDQFIQLTVVMPPQIDDELAAFIKQWRERHAYTVRETGKERS